VKLLHLKTDIVFWIGCIPDFIGFCLLAYIISPLYDATFSEGQQEKISQLSESQGIQAAIKFFLLLLCKKVAKFVVGSTLTITLAPLMVIGFIMFLIGLFIWEQVEDYFWPFRRWLLQRQWEKLSSDQPSPEATRSTAQPQQLAKLANTEVQPRSS